ncbi:MAG: LysR family transcriptional regulator [Caldimonas sp.]
MPSIRNLRTFLAVARLGSFAAAAKDVGLTSAAVGQQVRALEDELRQVLFDRGGRAIVLNTAGRALVEPVEELVGRYQALAHVAPANGGLSGSVVVGALVSALMGEFADALWTLKREHPALEVRLFAGLSSDFAKQVERGELDAAIVTEPPGRLAPHLVWTALYREPMVLVVPKRPHFSLATEPLAILRRSPFIRFDRHTWTGALVDRAIAQCAVEVRDELELNSVEAILALVRQGFGISIVPQLRNVDFSRDRGLRIVALPRIDVARNVGLLERRQHTRTRFTAAIKAYFASPRPARSHRL